MVRTAVQMWRSYCDRFQKNPAFPFEQFFTSGRHESSGVRGFGAPKQKSHRQLGINPKTLAEAEALPPGQVVRVTMQLLLSATYAAARRHNLPVLPSDILRWARTESLPYGTAWAALPGDVRQGLAFSSAQSFFAVGLVQSVA